MNIKNLENLLDKWQLSILDFIPKIFLAIFIIVVFYFIAKLLRSLYLKFYPKVFKKQNDITKVISEVVYFLFLLSGIFLALEVLGLESILTKLLAGAGIIGVIAGFAFKDIASNAFAGILLNIQRPFGINDWVEIDANFGTIKEVGLIATSIKTISGQEVFVPNQLIYNNTFINY